MARFRAFTWPSQRFSRALATSVIGITGRTNVNYALSHRWYISVRLLTYLPALERPVSIHAPPEEGDVARAVAAERRMTFQSTPPRRRATVDAAISSMAAAFQSTPPRRRATRAADVTSIAADCFNPRPPGGGRPQRRSLSCMPSHVSIHAPPEEGDADDARADCAQRCRFNPRPPGGGRPERRSQPIVMQHVSIHAPPEEGDVRLRGIAARSNVFQSTPPRRRATVGAPSCMRLTQRFNPRPPGGGRPVRC